MYHREVPEPISQLISDYKSNIRGLDQRLRRWSGMQTSVSQYPSFFISKKQHSLFSMYGSYGYV